jgi:glutaminyl-peptide cyclotransferase
MGFDLQKARRAIPPPTSEQKQGAVILTAISQRISIPKIAFVLLILFFISGFTTWLLLFAETPVQEKFDGQRAWEDVAHQTSLGPRIPGSQAHAETVEWIQAELEEAGWEAEVQEAEMMGHPIFNVVGRIPGNDYKDGPWLILGAHYDSRIYADLDPDPAKRSEPVPGANDGASGVAVLLELSRVLPKDLSNHLWLVFFDAEDNGNIPGWDWILGSRAFVDNLEGRPDAAVIVDMIGDADLNIYKERNSDDQLLREIWETAHELGYSEQFIPSYKYSILDDHTPFLRAGIPAADLIDFDYPYWHTTADTADKVSPESLQAVGDTLFAWLTKSEMSLVTSESSNSWYEKLMSFLRRERVR